MEETNTDPTAPLNLVLLGRSRAGISAAGNTILGREAFTSKKSSSSVTQDVAEASKMVGQLPVTVYDTPGLFNTDVLQDEILQMINEKVLQRCESGPCVFLLVIKADRFSEEERQTVEKIEELLGEKRLEKTWILFTRGDELEEGNITINEFINGTEPMKNLVQKYDQRYHVFNNKKKTEHEELQVKMLLLKILQSYFEIKEEEEVLEILKPNQEKEIKKDIEQDAPADSLPSRRIVLLGKSGVGKSAAGNTILGQKEFISVMSTSSVTSECSEAHATVSGKSVSIVDTPGFFDTKMSFEELMMEIARSVYLSSPGPHAFLIVLRVSDRFTEQEQQIPQIIEMMFGKEVLKYSIILFTNGDLLERESVEELIKKNSALRDLVQQCGGRYQVFNNKDQNNREQVNNLLEKIDTMIEQNGGGHYSNEMYKEAQRFRQEEEEQRKQQEVKQRQDEIEGVKKKAEEKIRAEMEAENKMEEKKEDGFMQFFSKHKHLFFWGAVVVGAAFGGAALGAYAGVAAAKALTGVVAAKAVGFAVGGVVGGAAAGAVAGSFAGAASGEGAAKGAAAGAVIGTAAGAAFVGTALGGACCVGSAVGKALGVAVGGGAAGAVANALGVAVGSGVVCGAASGAVVGASSGEGAVKGAAAGAAVGAAAGAAVGAAAGAAFVGTAVGGACCAGSAVGKALGVAVGGIGGGAVGGAAAGAVVGAASGEGAAKGAAVGAAAGAGAGVTAGAAVVSAAVGGAYCAGNAVAEALGFAVDVAVGGVSGGVGGGAAVVGAVAGAASGEGAAKEAAAGTQ